MEHKQIRALFSAYFDGELSDDQRGRVNDHVAQCADCRRELEAMKKFEEVMGKMKLKNPPKETWQRYWASVYNRLERRIGWILVSIGGMILFFFGGYKAVEGIINDPATPLLLKVGILAFLGGIVVLLVSLLREQLFVRKRERYKEIEK